MKRNLFTLMAFAWGLTHLPSPVSAQEWYAGPNLPTHNAPVPNLVQGTPGGDYYTKDVGVDKNGNVFVVGAYTGTLGNTASAGGSYDGFVAKFSAMGVLQYLSVVSTQYDDELCGVAVDINGNAYFTGRFNDFTATVRRVFPSAAGSVVSLTPSGGGGLNGITHAVCGRLNPDGTVGWAQQLITYNSPGCGASNYSEGLDVAMDQSAGTPMAIFGGITTTNTVFSRGLPLTSCNLSTDITVVNPHPAYVIPMGYTAAYSNCGKLLWGRVIQPNNTNAHSAVRGVSISRSSVYPNHNGVFITGEYTDANTFPGMPNIVMNTTGQKGFVARLAFGSGRAEWVDDISGDYVSGKAIALTYSGSEVQPVVTGDFYSTAPVAFNNGISANAVSYNYEVFVSKYNYAGNCQWARTAGGPYDDEVNGIACSKTSLNEIFITGSFVYDFAFGSQTLSNTYGAFNTINRHLFLGKLDQSGNMYWADDLHGECGGEYSIGENVCVDGAGVARPYVTGSIMNTYLNYPNPGLELSLLPNAGGPCGFYAAHYNDLCMAVPYQNFAVNRMPGSSTATVSFSTPMFGPYRIYYRIKQTAAYPDPKCYDPTPWTLYMHNVSVPGSQSITIGGLSPMDIYEWGMIPPNSCGVENNMMPISTNIVESTLMAREQPVSVAATESAQVLCYPNPLSDVLHIRLHQVPKGERVLLVYNALGQLILREPFTDEEHHSVRTHEWPSGNYFYTVLNNNEKLQSGMLRK